MSADEIQTQNGFVLIMYKNGLPCLMVPTADTTKLNDDETVAEGFDALRTQMLSTLAATATTEVKRAEMEAWLITNQGYVPSTSTNETE
ncbi:MAG: hypothetical protein R3Y11_12595 [Pseudomonadota bacterium]